MSPAAKMIEGLLEGIKVEQVSAGWVATNADITCKVSADAERVVSRLRTLGMQARRTGPTGLTVVADWGTR